MAGVKDNMIDGVGPWPQGVNNLAKEGKLPTDENGRPIALREADNIDLDRAGWPSRRPGSDRFFPGVLTHSLWSDNALSFGLFVNDGELHALFADESTEALGVYVGHQPLSYALFSDRVLWSNRSVSGLLTLDLQNWRWAPEQPAGQPTLAATPGFGLNPGQYQVAVTFRDAMGRESGSTLAAKVDVPEGSGIAVSNIPQPVDPAQAPVISLYMTDANDQVLRLRANFAAGVTSYVIGQPATGRALRTQFMSEMPAGQIVRLYNGRQYVADGRSMRWSPTMRYGLTRRSKDVIRFPAEIDMIEPVDGEGGGVYVAAGGRTYWHGGADPKDFTQRIAHSSGVVPGSSLRVPGNAIGMENAKDVTVWVARNGQFCLGLPGGNVVPLKDGEAVIDDGDRAAVMFRQGNGLQQFIAAFRGPRRSGLGIQDTAIAHIVHDQR